MEPEQDLWMVCSDGVRLATRLWRPAGVGPWPVLLMRQPYGRAIASTITYAHPSWYAARGFLVAVQDVRGRGDSEGNFGGFAQEARDGAAAVRWARQLPQSNGRVGTYGFSYQGLTQLLIGGPTGAEVLPGQVAATAEDDLPDPLPDCLAPAMCGLDERLHWASEGGAHWWALGVGWALQLAAEGCRRRGDGDGWGRIRMSLANGAFLQEGPELLDRYDPDGMGIGWLRRDAASSVGWPIHGTHPELLKRPMLLIGGWHDPHLMGLLDLRQRAIKAGGLPQLRIGDWTHLQWRGGIDALQLDFFRRHLVEPTVTGGRSITPGDEAPSRLAPVWTQEIGGTSWQPLVDAPFEPPLWALQSDGLAAIRSDEGALQPATEGSGGGGGSVTLVHDPWRPCPGQGGHLGLAAGVVDRSDLDERADVACFNGPRQTTPMRLFGIPRLLVTVASDQPGFDLCVALGVVSADGRVVRQLSIGVLRQLGPECLEAKERSVRLQPLDATLAPGERLRLSLAAAAWPQIAVNPGDGSLPQGGSSHRHRVISLTFLLSGSRLRLEPLLPPAPEGSRDRGVAETQADWPAGD